MVYYGFMQHIVRFPQQRDLVMECEEEGEAATHIWKKHLDPQIAPADKPGPLEALDLSSLACRCLDRRKKKRPPMAEVSKELSGQIND